MTVYKDANTEVLYEDKLIFDPMVENHGHVHASCMVECPNGDLIAVWYENGAKLPPPYFSENRDKSDDVHIGGARQPQRARAWEKPFVMSDTFGLSSNNPCMVIDAQERLWLVHPTLLGVPRWTWGSALLRYSISSQYDKPGKPVWDKVDILVPHVAELEELGSENRLKSRLGWMSRAHPLVRSDGAVVIPLANENFNLAVMAITQDGGETWTFSRPVPGGRVTQPTLVEFSDGSIAAFFRSSKRIRRSDSSDGGLTWSELKMTELPHPGAGIEAILLRNGHLLMIYNDKEDARDRLAVSISTDRGQTWDWTRHLEDTPGGRFDYPSIIQAMDETIHATYSYNLSTIKHVHFSEAWVKQGKQQA
ncbi:MAG: sialidase family protein [Planctomycetota bacterium]